MSVMSAISIRPSSREGSKWVVDYGGHKIHFGARGYEDFTQHHDEFRRAAYIRRHATRERWDDPMTAGFWSRWLLWENRDIVAAARNISRYLGRPIDLQLTSN